MKLKGISEKASTISQRTAVEVEQNVLCLTSFGQYQQCPLFREKSWASDREINNDCKTNTITTNAQSGRSVVAAAISNHSNQKTHL